MGRMPTRGAPMRNSASGFRHPFFNDRREDRFEARHPFFNDRREDRLEARHFFFNHRPFVRNRAVFVNNSFAFPFFYPFPYYGFYPYPYYPYAYFGYNYYGGGAYGYGSGDQSRVAALQGQLARAGYYHGAIDGIMGPQTRRAIRAFQRHHNMYGYGPIDEQLLATMGFG